MADLTLAQLNAIRKLTADHHWAFVANTVGPDAVPPEILIDLKSRNLIDTKTQWTQEAFRYGQALAASRDPKFATMSLAEYRRWEAKNPIPLSAQERNAMEWAAHNAAESVTAMGDRARAQIAREVVENIQTRGSLKQLRSNLGHMSEDWLRDWDRVAVTEKQNSMQAGYAANVEEEFGEDALVFKRPSSDACRQCKRVFLIPGTDIPRIFRLSELTGNGTNVGRKAADFQPVAGVVHPFCLCDLSRVPEGYGFNDDGQMVPGGKHKRIEKSLPRVLGDESELRKAFKLQGRTTFQGLPIAIENKAGTYRKWVDQKGDKGQTYMHFAYGYIFGTLGADEDEVDVFLGPDPNAPNVFVVHQQDPGTGTYDEDKNFLGFHTEAQVRAVYAAHYDRPDFLASVSVLSMDHFKRWLEFGKPEEGTMMKGPPLVIPLTKAVLTTSGKLYTTEAIRGDKAGARSPSGLHGDAANQVFHAPRGEVSSPDPEMVREYLFGQAKVENPGDAAYMDIESDYTLLESPRKSHKMEIPDTFAEGLQPTSEEIKIRRKRIEEKRRERLAAVKNHVEVSNDTGGEDA